MSKFGDRLEKAFEEARNNASAPWASLSGDARQVMLECGHDKCQMKHGPDWITPPNACFYYEMVYRLAP